MSKKIKKLFLVAFLGLVYQYWFLKINCTYSSGFQLPQSPNVYEVIFIFFSIIQLIVVFLSFRFLRSEKVSKYYLISFLAFSSVILAGNFFGKILEASTILDSQIYKLELFDNGTFNFYVEDYDELVRFEGYYIIEDGEVKLFENEEEEFYISEEIIDKINLEKKIKCNFSYPFKENWTLKIK
ncbi:hypothetical protein [Aureivirga sp. CE67]|uniref:hypothetical protein n=1 Tax=Aureivirga sp. CE67 TaxID=1788983 RepID=UPI0018C96130|nr:hypothetical protein [Aureivirga sp. CE67]